jgi:hypothetical protein
MAIEGKEWLYFLVDSMGRTGQVENGLIVFKSNYKPLVYTPDGWEDVNIAWERNLTKFGINRNFSLPLGFVLDGKQILDYIGLNKNFDEKIFLLIQKQALFSDPTKYYYFYDKFYKGELDITTINSEEDKTTIGIMEGGLSKQLKAKEATNFEFPVDDPEAITINADGLFLNERLNFLIPGATGGEFPSPPISLPIRHLMYTSIINREGNAVGVATFDVVGHLSLPDFETSDEYFLAVTQEILNMRITGSVSFKASNTADEYRLELRTNTGRTILLASQLNVVHDGTYTLHFDLEFDAFTGEKFFLIADSEDGPFFVAEYNQTEFYIKFASRYKPTTITGLKASTLYKRLIGRITGSEANALSTLLALYPNLVVTCGDAVRGILDTATTKVVIKTNLNDFFTSFNAVLNAGIGIENNKVVFENKAHFFDESDPIHLGKVRGFGWKYATEILANSIKIGWPNQTYDDVNGRQEFNTTQERLSVVERASKPLELVSVYRADPFGIELTRINLEGKTTTDSSSDNDVFIINVDMSAPNDDGSYNLKRETYDSITGLLSPDTAFNIEELTPARMLARHANWINSIFYGFEGSKLTYQTSDKNRELRTVKGSAVYDEDADFTIGDSPRLLKPILFEFEPETPINLVELMEENPNRCFSFEHPNGNIYKGFNMKIGIAANTLEEQNYQLISAPSNDLKTLSDG